LFPKISSIFQHLPASTNFTPICPYSETNASSRTPIPLSPSAMTRYCFSSGIIERFSK